MKTHDVLTLLFVGFAALSSVAMAVAARNYMEFFPAVEAVAVSVASLEFHLEEPSPKIVVLFVIVNPTGYSGLGMRSLQASLTFRYPNGTDVPYGAPPGLPRPTVVLAPHSRLEISKELLMPKDVWAPIAEDLKEGEVVAEFLVGLSLSTFLDTVSWLIISYSCTLGQWPLDCGRQGATAFSPSAPGGA